MIEDKKVESYASRYSYVAIQSILFIAQIETMIEMIIP